MPKTPLFIPSTDEEEGEDAPAAQRSPSEDAGPEPSDAEVEHEEADDEPPSASTRSSRGGRRGRGAPRGGRAAAATRSKKPAPPAASKATTAAEVAISTVCLPLLPFQNPY